MKIIISVVTWFIMANAYGTIVPIDLGPPRLVHSGTEISFTAATLNGTPVQGQTLSLDYQFSNLIHLFPGASSLYVAVRAQTNMTPAADALYPGVCSSAYAVGLNGFVGPTFDYPGNTMVLGPNVTEILFGLSNPVGYGGSVSPNLYLTGLHFDLTLPDIAGVQITGLTCTVGTIGAFWEPKNFAIESHVPDNNSSLALLGLGFLPLLAFRYDHQTKRCVRK